MLCTASLLAVLFCLDGALQLVLGPVSSPDKRWDLNRSLVDMVAGKSQRVADGYAERPDPLIVALGASSIRLGLDSERLQERSGVPWLNLGVLGASLITMNDHYPPLWRSGLQPDVVVLGIHSCWMGRDPSFRDRKDSYDPAPAFWLSRNRAPLSSRWQGSLLKARANLGLSAWPEELWETRQKFFPTVHPAFLEWQLREVTLRGYFHPALYRREGGETLALLELLSELKGRRVPRVILVDMPVRAEIRQRTPATASQLLAWCAATAAVPGLELHDLRGAVDDSGFVDYFHVSQSGELQLSDALARLVARPQPTALEGGEKPASSSR